jgi:hypothetical protein
MGLEMAAHREVSKFLVSLGAVLVAWRIALSPVLDPSWGNIVSALAIWHLSSGLLLWARHRYVYARMGMMGFIVLVLSIISAATLKLLNSGDAIFVQIVLVVIGLFLYRNRPRGEFESPSPLPPPPPLDPDQPSPAPVPIFPAPPARSAREARVIQFRS